MVDTHTHLNFEAFKDDWKEVVKRALQTGVEKMIVVGTDAESSRRAVEMAQEHPTLFASVGVHPHHVRALLGSSNVKTQISNSMNELRELALNDRVVAIGEVGLDYHTYSKSKRYEVEVTEEQWKSVKELQQELFRAQVSLAQELNKPLIIHSREVGDDVLEMLNQVQHDGRVRGVFHCFDGSKKYVRKILEAGFYVSFTGNITFIPDRAVVAREVPLDRLLLETDCPFIIPEPIHSERSRAPWRSEPVDVTIIARFHARERQLQLIEIARQTTQNAKRLFAFDG